MLKPDAPSDEVLARYASLLGDYTRSWPSWFTGPHREDVPTHIELMWWHRDNEGWIGDKSNVEGARCLIRAAADEGRTDTEVSDEQVYECGGGSSAWDVAQLYVQVYEGGCPDDCPGHAQECPPECDASAEVRHRFDDRERTHGRATGLLIRANDFRCFDCFDASFYEREATAEDAEQRCTYCKARVFLPPALIARLESTAELCLGQDCEGDCRGTRTYTAAFRTAVALAEYIKNDHPFLDEDDYYEQRRETFEASLDAVLEDIRLHFPCDTEEDHRGIVEHASDDLWELEHNEPDGYVDLDDARRAYDLGRDLHFLDLGRTFMRNEIPGQTALIPA
ncbi:hypothetical protein ACWDR0_10450 [Streptomyces sp. NPDC003691]